MIRIEAMHISGTDTVVERCANSLTDTLHAQPALEFAVLIGSRANDTSIAESDWDIALQ